MPSSSISSNEELESSDTESVSSAESIEENPNPAPSVAAYAGTIQDLVPNLPWELRPKLAQSRAELRAATAHCIGEDDKQWQKDAEAEDRSVIDEVLSTIAQAAIKAARDPECDDESRNEYVDVGEWCVAAQKNGLSDDERAALCRIWGLW